MKSILPFLLSILLAIPALADSTTVCSKTNNEEDCLACIQQTGYYYNDEFEDCLQCAQDQYNNGNFLMCQNCSDFNFNNGQIYDSAHGVAGQSSCPWMCDNGYYRGGANDDTCIQCTGNLTCYGTGLEYSNTYNPTGISCSINYRLVPDDTTHTYSCESCTDSHATLNGNNCVCNVGYYGTPNGVNTTCTACPAGTTSADGSTKVSNCQMTPDTLFCDAKGRNCMKLLYGQNSINK